MTANWNRTRLLTAVALLSLAASSRASDPEPIFNERPRQSAPEVAPPLLSPLPPPDSSPAPSAGDSSPIRSSSEGLPTWVVAPSPASARSPYLRGGAQSRYELVSASEQSDYLPSELPKALGPQGIYSDPADPNSPLHFEPPLGFTGPSSVLPRSGSNADFITVEDRWRIGFPEWDRYNKGQPTVNDYPYELGRIFDPYNQNVLKGDYPIIGQHTFLNLTALSLTNFEPRLAPTPTTPFESTGRRDQQEFFGRPNQTIFSQLFLFSADLFHGDQLAFKPIDWRIKLTPAFNINSLQVSELAIVNPDVRKGVARNRTWATLQEWFAEAKLADLSPEYDFVSLRVGSQPFVSDFRGFLFVDTNRAVRLFGTYAANRYQFNLVYFDLLDKDTNSGLNDLDNVRHQQVFIANIFRQDTIVPGYQVQASFHFNNDGPSVQFDKNRFLVRPDPAGVNQPHRVQVAYLGLAGDGHIGRFNVSHQFYWALGYDSRNPIATTSQDINGQLAACEVSYDRDWARFRVSGFYQSGDGNVNNRHATGFDSINDQVNFAGSEFSYFGRQAIGLFGVNLTQRQSLYADLRSSKTQGQSNFVNPGLWVGNIGLDLDVTPKFRVINNANFMWFDKTNSLEVFTFQGSIEREIGVDLSMGIEYRPFLNNNVIFLFGASTLIPASGFKALYDNLRGEANPLAAAFLEMTLAF